MLSLRASTFAKPCVVPQCRMFCITFSTLPLSANDSVNHHYFKCCPFLASVDSYCGTTQNEDLSVPVKERKFFSSAINLIFSLGLFPHRLEITLYLVR